MTKRQLLENVSSEELTEWAAYYKVLNDESETAQDKHKKERAAHEEARKQAR